MMKHKYHQKPEADPALAHVCKERQCLKCGVKFESKWSGDRICSKCKNGSAWREGATWLSWSRPA